MAGRREEKTRLPYGGRRKISVREKAVGRADCQDRDKGLLNLLDPLDGGGQKQKKISVGTAGPSKGGQLKVHEHSSS